MLVIFIKHSFSEVFLLDSDFYLENECILFILQSKLYYSKLFIIVIITLIFLVVSQNLLVSEVLVGHDNKRQTQSSFRTS